MFLCRKSRFKTICFPDGHPPGSGLWLNWDCCLQPRAVCRGSRQVTIPAPRRPLSHTHTAAKAEGKTGGKAEGKTGKAEGKTGCKAEGKMGAKAEGKTGGKAALG